MDKITSKIITSLLKLRNEIPKLARRAINAVTQQQGNIKSSSYN